MLCRGTPGGVKSQRKAAAALGLISAIGAYGGFLIPQVLNASQLATGGYTAAFYGFVGAYVVLMVITVLVYVIPRTSLARPAHLTHPDEAGRLPRVRPASSCVRRSGSRRCRRRRPLPPNRHIAAIGTASGDPPPFANGRPRRVAAAGASVHVADVALLRDEAAS